MGYFLGLLTIPELYEEEEFFFRQDFTPLLFIVPKV
jgi:hypothetical protein